MLSFIIWIIEIVNIVLNSINAGNCFNAAKQLKNNGDIGNLSAYFNNMGGAYIVNIIVSFIFCLAITIAYERSRINKERIDDINYALMSKNKKKDLEYNKKSKEEQKEWIVTTDSFDELVRVEKDDNIDNVAKKDECPICFSHINPEDKKCSNCGTKLKNKKL